MVLLRLRVGLPDRPGSLGRVTEVLGRTGADVLQMTVLERGVGRAVDEFTIAWPAPTAPTKLIEALEAIPGVRVEGLHRTREVPGAFADLELLTQIAKAPTRALASLVDAVPSLLSADWCAVVTTHPATDPIYASWQAPTPLQIPDLTPLRPRVLQAVDGTHIASAPMPRSPLAVLAARRSDPAFHRVELLRLTRIVGLVAVIAADEVLESRAS